MPLIKAKNDSNPVTSPSLEVMDKVILFLLVLSLPFQEMLGVGEETSIVWAIFFVCSLYALIFRFNRLEQILFRPIPLVFFLFLLFATFSEWMHFQPDFGEIKQSLQMLGGAAVMASLVGGDQTLRVIGFAMLLNGVWLSILLVGSTYVFLTSVSDYLNPSQVRVDATASMEFFRLSWNAIAFYCAQGAAFALILIILEKAAAWRKAIYAIAGIICMVGMFFTMSRTGIVTLGLMALIVFWSAGIFRLAHLQYLVLTLVFFYLVWMMVPEVIVDRLTNPAGNIEGARDSRYIVLDAVLYHLDEYFLWGLGCGNFWKTWGFSSQFMLSEKGVTGAHNVYFQATIYWGVVALAFLFCLVVLLFHFIRKMSGPLSQLVFIRCMGMGTLTLSLLVHNFYLKEFSVGLAIILAGERLYGSHRSAREDA